MELSDPAAKKNGTPKDIAVTLCSTDIKTPPEKEDVVRKKRLRRQVDQLISNSTINGLSQAFSAEKQNYRIFWIVLFFLGVVGFGINLYHIVDNYAQGPILTQLDQEYTPFQWPQFTICNPMNPIPFWNTPDLKEKWEALYKKAESYKLPDYGIKSQEIRLRPLWGHEIAMSSINPSDFYRNGIRGNVLSVSIKHREASIGTSSGRFDNFHGVRNLEEIFEATLDSSRSPIPCYTLNPERLAKAVGKETLHDQLLSIKMYITMDFESHKFFNHGYESRKIYFYLTHQNTTLQSSTPFFILPGTMNQFEMKQKTHKRVSDCRKEEFHVDMYDTTMETSRDIVGNFDDCRMHLSQQIFFKECKCYNPNLPLYRFDNNLPRLCTNTSIYSNSEMAKNIHCLNRVIREDVDNKKFRVRLLERCQLYIKPRCVSSRYIVSRSTDVWQEDMSDNRRIRLLKGVKHLENAPENATEDFSRKNMAIVTLSWNMEQTEVTYEQYEYPTSQFVSDLGGIAGLWIGLSVISMFEIMELIFVFFKSVRA